MSMKVLTNKDQRRKRIRAKIWGTSERPRLSVNISNKHIVAQLIDDDKGVTLGYVTTVRNKDVKGNMTEKAKTVGEQIAEIATKKKIKTVIFDRGTRIYHGRLSSLANAARDKGLEF